jgi:hypothetical protein
MNLYIDIETIGTEREDVRKYIAATIKPPGTYKKAETIAKWEAEEKPQAIQDAIQKTGLDGAFGQVVVIGYAIDDLPVHTIYSDNEYMALLQFNAELSKKIPVNKLFDTTVVGHNIAGFDLRFLFQRQIVHKLKPHPVMIRATQAKPWESEKVFDTMVQFAGQGNRISLEKLCLALSLPSPKGEMDGSQVWDFIKAGKSDEVQKYCKADVEAVRQIHSRMKFLSDVIQPETEDAEIF